jgi:hypothetical protein
MLTSSNSSFLNFKVVFTSLLQHVSTDVVIIRSFEIAVEIAALPCLGFELIDRSAAGTRCGRFL